MSEKFISLGIMSGTSLDGVDLAICSFQNDGDRWKYNIIKAECIPYSVEWIKKLQTASQLSGYELIRLHKEYGFYLGNLVNDFMDNDANIDFISSHGHTIFHHPAEFVSFQLGDGAAIAARTGLTTISDFRNLDVCLGGQGAPLVPIGDELLFTEYDFCLNLGGIANMSFYQDGKRLAYDLCPCNLLLNHFASLSGFTYDAGGELARQGEINHSLLNTLNSWEYYKLTPPKSLDKDTLLKDLLPLINSHYMPVNDILATLTEHIASQIILEINKHQYHKPTVLVTGGGAFNTFLIEKLNQKSNIKFIIPDEQTIKFKEALIFAFLGVLRTLNIPNALSTVTGAKYDSVGGAIYKG